MKPDSFHLSQPGLGEPREKPAADSSGWLDRLRERWLPQDGGRELDVRLCGRGLRARLSPAACTAVSRLQAPLTVEMELYFSCLVRKAVYFSTASAATELPEGGRTELLPNLFLQFRPVTTAHCSVAEVGDKPPVETMPVVKPQAFVPRWVNIDFHRGRWVGEYGY